MSDIDTSVWTPEKPAAAFTEEEVRQSPDFQNLRSQMPASVISDEKVIGLAREIIETRWTSVRDSRRSELVEEFVNKMRECDPELAKVSQLVITLDDEDGHVFEVKKARAPRWSEETYAENLGEFTKEYNSDKYVEASGEYKLNIREGRNGDEKVFMELTEPSGRVLAYPPLNAESPVDTAERKEVTSISRLLRDSTHRTTLSVWQYFGLQREEEN